MARIRVLIVDDQEDLTRTLAEYLRLYDYPVDTANDPHVAVEMMAKNLYKLVLSDIQMPGMNGLELLKALKSRSPMVLVIMMTAYHDQAMVVECLEHGAHDFLVKPLEPLDQVVSVVQQAEEKILRWADALRPAKYPQS